MTHRSSSKVAWPALARRLPPYRACLTAGVIVIIAILIISTSTQVRHKSDANCTEVRVFGTVHYKGVPIKEGRISFDVQFSDPAYRPTSFKAVIRNGRFDVPKGEGSEPGTFVVQILTGRVVEQPIKIYRAKPDEEGMVRAPWGSGLMITLGPDRENELNFRLQ